MNEIIPDYQSSVILNETVELLLELNKKRKKNHLLKSEESSQKKTKLNQDDDIDIDINDRDIESLSFSTINTDVVMKQVFIACETGKINTNSKKIWYNTLNKVKKYIDQNNKRPSFRNKDKEIQKLGSWLSNQLNKYKNKKEIMKNKDIYSE